MLLNSMCPIALKFQNCCSGPTYNLLQIILTPWDGHAHFWQLLLWQVFQKLHNGREFHPMIYHGSNLQAAWTRKISQSSCEMLCAPPARSPLKHFGVYLGIHSLVLVVSNSSSKILTTFWVDYETKNKTKLSTSSLLSLHPMKIWVE